MRLLGKSSVYTLLVQVSLVALEELYYTLRMSNVLKILGLKAVVLPTMLFNYLLIVNGASKMSTQRLMH